MLPVIASQQRIGIPPNCLKNISTRYFNTNNGGSKRKSSALKDLETTEEGLETIEFLAKETP